VYITQKGCNTRYIVVIQTLKVQHHLQQGCNTRYIIVYQEFTWPQNCQSGGNQPVGPVTPLSIRHLKCNKTSNISYFVVNQAFKRHKKVFPWIFSAKGVKSTRQVENSKDTNVKTNGKP
jgi:hypothetical protein